MQRRSSLRDTWKKPVEGLLPRLFYHGVVFDELFDAFEHFFVGGACLLKGVIEEQVGRFERDGFVQEDAIVLGRDFRDIGDVGGGKLIRLGVDGIFGDGDDVGAVFDFELKRSPLQAVGDVVTAHAGRGVCRALHFDDERMDFVMLAVVGDGADDGPRVGTDEDFFFEGSLSHAAIILAPPQKSEGYGETRTRI